ncbi:hypothetical protein FOY91_06500 [Sphingomonas solaris]|uniref:Uncharacterized protein n=1 Tax=Alterirhizorhabdus solaris TaxID=2529389 RepID=A0A558R8E4_9SPHN|nr:hypothetical protein FOY91_06500 [Sphingomonas solaris]
MEAPVKDQRAGFGCLLTILVINALLMGLFALGFTQGPYSSREQELWYRYGSIGFLTGGVVLPAYALLLGGKRASWTIVPLTVWMVAALFAFLVYVFYSGGGV